MNRHPNQAQGILSTMGIIDSGLEALVQEYGPEIDQEVNETLAKARESNCTFFFHKCGVWPRLNRVACRFVLPKMEADEGAHLSH